jgi:hypothetical protein
MRVMSLQQKQHQQQQQQQQQKKMLHTDMSEHHTGGRSSVSRAFALPQLSGMRAISLQQQQQQQQQEHILLARHTGGRSSLRKHLPWLVCLADVQCACSSSSSRNGA